MLKKRIKYKALDGRPLEGDFYFHLSKAKLAEMALVRGMDYEDRMNELVQKRDAQKVIDIFKDLIRDAYGERDSDGIHFVQSPEVSTRFEQTDAWSELFVELVTDAEAGAEFFTGVMPEEVAQKIRTGDKVPTQIETTPLPDAPEPEPTPAPEPELTKEEPAKGSIEYYNNMLANPDWLPTKWDLQRMNNDQMQEAFARKLGA